MFICIRISFAAIFLPFILCDGVPYLLVSLFLLYYQTVRVVKCAVHTRPIHLDFLDSKFSSKCFLSSLCRPSLLLSSPCSLLPFFSLFFPFLSSTLLLLFLVSFLISLIYSLLSFLLPCTLNSSTIMALREGLPVRKCWVDGSQGVITGHFYLPRKWAVEMNQTASLLKHKSRCIFLCDGEMQLSRKVLVV